MIWLQFVFYCVAVPLPRMNPYGVTSVLSSWRERGRVRHSKTCMVTKVLAGITYPMSGNFLVVVSTLKTGSSSNIAVRRAKVAKQLPSTEYHMASRNRRDWHQRPLRRQLLVLSSLSPLSKLPPPPQPNILSSNWRIRRSSSSAGVTSLLPPVPHDTTPPHVHIHDIEHATIRDFATLRCANPQH